MLSVKLGIVWLAFCSRYEADNRDVRQVEDEFVVEDQSEDGSQNLRQPSGTSIDRYEL